MIPFLSRLVVGFAIIIGVLGFSVSLAASEVGEGEINPSWDSDGEAPNGDLDTQGTLHTIDKDEFSPDDTEIKGLDSEDIDPQTTMGPDPMDPIEEPVQEGMQQPELYEDFAEGDASVDADASGKEGGASGEDPANALDQNKHVGLGAKIAINPTTGMLGATVPVSNTISISGAWSLGLHAVYNYQAYSYVQNVQETTSTHYETAHNAMVNFAYNWGWKEQALVYIKREYNITDNGDDTDTVNAWYDYYELYSAGSIIRFYRVSPLHAISSYYEEPEQVPGAYAAEAYNPAWDCDPKCSLNYGGDNKAFLYSRDGNNLKMMLEQSSEGKPGRITVYYPNGAYQQFSYFSGDTDYFPSLVAGQTIGVDTDYRYKTLRAPSYLTFQGMSQKSGGLVYKYGSESEMLTAEDPAGYSFNYYPLRSICDAMNESRCVTIDYSNADPASNTRTLRVKSVGYGGVELTWELEINYQRLTQVRTPELQSGGETETGEIDIEYVYDDQEIDYEEDLDFELAPEEGGPRQVISKIVPLHPADTSPNSYYEFAYADPSEGEKKPVFRAETTMQTPDGVTSYSQELTPYVYGRVSDFYRVLGDKKEEYNYRYDVSGEEKYYAGNYDFACGNSTCKKTIAKYARGYRTVEIIDSKSNKTAHLISLYLNRLKYYPEEPGVTRMPIYSGQFEDIPRENTAVSEKIYDGDSGSFSYLIEYLTSPSGKILHSERYVNSSNVLVLKSQSDYAYSRGSEEQAEQVKDVYRLEEMVNWSIGDDGTELITHTEYKYDDPYGRLTQTKLYKHVDNSDAPATLVKDSKLQYTEWVDVDHWLCGANFMTQVKAKEFNSSSPYYNWPYHGGYVQRFYQWFDFNMDEGEKGLLMYKELGDSAAEDGTQMHRYYYLTGSEGRGYQGQLAETYWYIPCGDSCDEMGDHRASSPKIKYSYDPNTGVPIKEEILPIGSSSPTAIVQRLVDPNTGLVKSETYFDGSKKDIKYDSLGRSVQVLTWSAPTESAAAALLTVGNMEYHDLGATIISWTDTSSSPLYLEPDAIPVFEARYDGHFDQWVKSYRDLFWRVVKEETLGSRGSATESEYPILKKKFVYDEKDRVVQSTEFNSGSADGNVNKIEYDELGRVFRQKSSTGVEISYHYPTPLTKIVDRVVTDQILERKYSYDVRGRLIKVTETLPEGSDWYDSDDLSKVEYRYDYADRMIEAISNDGEQTRKWTYSTAGVLLKSTYPEDSASGVDSSDDLLYTTKIHQHGVCGPEIWSDATERKMQNRYNSWCEITSTLDPGTGNPYLNLTYDSKHRLDTKTNYQDELDSWVKEKFYYDIGNHINNVGTTVHYRDNPEVVFQTAYRYDNQGRLRSLDYPDLYQYGDTYYQVSRHGLAYSYDASGALSRISRGDFSNDLKTISNVALSGQWDFSYESTWGGLKQYVFNKGTSSVTLKHALDSVGRLKSYEAIIGSASTSSSGTKPGFSNPTVSPTMNSKTAKQKTGGPKIGQTGQASPSPALGQMAPISSTSMGSTPITLFSGTYEYDVSGLLTSIGTTDELLQGKIHSRKLYGYDRLGRLSAAGYNKNRNGTDKSIWREYFNYDRNGNLSDRADDSAAYRLVFIDSTEKLGRFGVDRSKNRVASTLFDGKSAYYEYNATGTVSSIEKYYEITQEFSYTPFNQLYAYDDHEANLSAEYLYDGSGLRIVKQVLNKDTDNEEILYTLYAAGLGSQQLATFKQSGSGTGAVPKLTERLFYTPLGLAYREEVMSPSYSTFSIPNHLGEVKFVVKESDRNWCARETLAYGDPLPEEAEAYLTVEKNCVAMMEGNVKDQLIPHEFGTHAKDIESNLSYMHLRFYDSTMKRFNSPDPMYDIDVAKPQSWNRYTYVSNRPNSGIDPTGGEGLGMISTPQPEGASLTPVGCPLACPGSAEPDANFSTDSDAYGSPYFDGWTGISGMLDIGGLGPIDRAWNDFANWWNPNIAAPTAQVVGSLYGKWMELGGYEGWGRYAAESAFILLSRDMVQAGDIQGGAAVMFVGRALADNVSFILKGRGGSRRNFDHVFRSAMSSVKDGRVTVPGYFNPETKKIEWFGDYTIKGKPSNFSLHIDLESGRIDQVSAPKNAGIPGSIMNLQGMQVSKGFDPNELFKDFRTTAP